jgi:hypothetical protein
MKHSQRSTENKLKKAMYATSYTTPEDKTVPSCQQTAVSMYAACTKNKMTLPAYPLNSKQQVNEPIISETH